MLSLLRTILVTACVVVPWIIPPAAAQDPGAAVAPAAETGVEYPSRPIGERIVRFVEKMFDPTPPAIVPTLGGVRRGSGFAPGVAFIAPVTRSRLTTRAVWSVQNTKRLEASFEMPPEIAGFGFVLDGYWEDAPETYWYGPGPHSGTTRHEYGLTTREITAQADLTVRGPFHVSGGVGYIDTPTTSAGDSLWIESGVAAYVDTRTSPGYTRRGGFYRLALDHFATQSSGHSGFYRMTVDARHFVPLVSENWVLAGQARAELTGGAADAPHFLLPYLGGGSSLRGFSTYRFVDRQAVLVRGELRWMASPALDMAAFVDTGVVAPELDAMRVGDRATGWGLGARFHGDRFTAFRIEAAHSTDGWKLHLGQNVSF
jgi:hypothetical protein